MKRTISVMMGKGSVSHNSRKFKAENVDADRSHLNIEYCNENIKDVYHELFDDAVMRYNEKQKRNDRRIPDYYEKIRSGKQEKPFHEMILQIGNRDDMNAQTEDGKLARTVLDEYYRDFQQRNPNLRVFSAHLHMDEATPHLHIDFVPFTTGSRQGLDTRVSLKQALATQGFKGGSRKETEWNQWVLSEKKHLAAVMERHGIEWEQKGIQKEHLSVLDYKKEQRATEVAELSEKIADKQDEFEALSKRIENYESGEKALSEISKSFDSAPEYQLPEPQGLITAKGYKTKFVEPLVKKLKSLVKSVLLRYFNARDDYERLNRANGKLYKENENFRYDNEKLSVENSRLKSESKDYSLLRKVFGNKQIDGLLEQAKELQQSKQRDKRFRNNNFER